jgi:hypothetical protein
VRRLLIALIWLTSAVIVIADTRRGMRAPTIHSTVAAPLSPSTSPDDSLFLLIRTEIPGPQPAFVCPGANAEQWDFGGSNSAQNWIDWARPTTGLNRTRYQH